MGGHLGDPYTIGGKRGMIPPASLSRVYPPPAGGHGASGPWPMVPMAPLTSFCQSGNWPMAPMAKDNKINKGQVQALAQGPSGVP